MQNSNQTPLLASNKDTQFLNQLKRTELYFKEFTATRYMAAVDTGINRANICRYIATLKKSNSIAIVKRDKCQISGCTAQYLTTNPELFPSDNQLKLWNENS